MNELRWIVVGAGFALIAGIYLWGRRSKRSVAEQPSATLQQSHERTVPQLDEAVVHGRQSIADPLPVHIDQSFDTADLPAIDSSVRVEPNFGDLSDFQDVAPESPAAAPAATDTREIPATSRPVAQPSEPRKPTRRKIIALRLSSGDSRVAGAKLKDWLEEAGLRHGRYGIYHRMYDEATPIFSVASMVEPGTFDTQTMRDAQFPGVTLFLQLPGPMEGMEMVTQMVNCARELEKKMGGILQDERGLPLTEPRAQRLRDDAADFLHLLAQP